MKRHVFIFDPISLDEKSKVRGIGRYLQILKENFPEWSFSAKLPTTYYKLPTTFINPFFNFLQPPLILKRIAKKQIAIIHDLIPLQFPKHFPAGIKGNINILLNKLALRNYDLIITDSNASKRTIQQILGVESNKVRVIYPCLPRIFTSTNPASAGDSSLGSDPRSYIARNDTGGNFCIYVGDATWNKNLINMVRALKIINVSCVLIGKVFQQETNNKKQANLLMHPWQRELQQFFQEIQNDKRFICAGFIPDEKLKDLYSKAKLNILPSREEGFGFSYLEAASQHCPSVLSDIPVFREISKNQGVLFAKPEDPQEIANNIGEIYFHEKARNKLGFDAHKQSLVFTSSTFRISWLQVIKDIQ